MLPHTSILDALIRLKLMEPSERPSFTELHGGISSEIYKRMADFKGSQEKVSIKNVIKKILN